MNMVSESPSHIHRIRLSPFRIAHVPRRPKHPPYHSDPPSFQPVTRVKLHTGRHRSPISDSPGHVACRRRGTSLAWLCVAVSLPRVDRAAASTDILSATMCLPRYSIGNPAACGHKREHISSPPPPPTMTPSSSPYRRPLALRRL
ncbi:hypothetical protein FA95DRAFT_667200 [Auriscalpium vulgare]|uniref:Uncharacterized protein n=1 Tax=Auriscalpium vulgare TaxID=40419 RepID=A0ACB8RCC7_9AGAM|nr:hypothetical protein FA95DRAFT_667200 [Auriscalpium vulgare]